MISELVDQQVHVYWSHSSLLTCSVSG